MIDKILQMLSSSVDGALSSKRVTFFFSALVYIAGTVYFVNDLIARGHVRQAESMWQTFAIVVLVLGGFVTADIFQRIFGKRGK
jgi:positive regulator of sigma E activity